MESRKPVSDAQLKLWTRRVKAEMEKGTSPEEALELIKQVMEAQAAGERFSEVVEAVDIDKDDKREILGR